MSHTKWRKKYLLDFVKKHKNWLLFVVMIIVMIIALIIPKKEKLHEPKKLFPNLEVDEIMSIEYGRYKKLSGKKEPEIVFTTTHIQKQKKWYNEQNKEIPKKFMENQILEKIEDLEYVKTIYVESDFQLEKWQIKKPNYIFKFNIKNAVKTLIVGTDNETLGYYYVTKKNNPDNAVFMMDESLINSLRMGIERQP